MTTWQDLEGEKLEEFGAGLFKKIGLNCLFNLSQANVSNLKSGYPNDEHIEIDYIIPLDKVCLIGEITARNNKEIKKKYNKFRETINFLKELEFSEKVWSELGVKQEDLRHLREIETLKSFFITTQKERYELNLSGVDDVAAFYKSDFGRLEEYSKSIGKWAKPYFLSNFCIENTPTSAITIYERDNTLIQSKNKKISGEDTPLSDLYTFEISPYELLEIAHVYRRDELPSFQPTAQNYQRPLDPTKLTKIRKNLITDEDFMFPSNILVVLSKECKYQEDGNGNKYLSIPKKYGSISIVDGQHRLFSYADEKIKSKIHNYAKIMVMAIDFKDCDEDLISQFSAKVFIEINTNQTKIEFSHLDIISYQLGSEDPKAIATKIIVNLNNRKNFRDFFDITTDNAINRGIVEAGTVINTLKKITNLKTIKKLGGARGEKQKLKKEGYEHIFEAEISELFDKEVFVEKGTVALEKYLNCTFSVFKGDQPQAKTEIFSSFSYSKFVAGFIDLFVAFIEEGLKWNEVQEELNKIKDNVIKLRNLDSPKRTQPIFDPKAPQIPDASSSPTKVFRFLQKNRENPCSIQDI